MAAHKGWNPRITKTIFPLVGKNLATFRRTRNLQL
jgi:hypothetical protein